MKKVAALLVAVTCMFAGSQAAAAEDGQILIVNKATNKMAFYNDGELVKVFSVATGAQNSTTPEGWFTIIKKAKNVPYYKTGIPGGDPRNPLGDRWIGLNITSDGMTYGIHGNNNESTIGQSVSQGCVRMHNVDVRWLYDQVETATPVTITHSTQSFDALAKAHGYELTVSNVEPYPTSMMTLEPVSLYSKPNDYYKTSSTIAPQRIQAFEKKGNWYHIKTWQGDSWIKAGPHIIVGAVSDINKKVDLAQSTNMYTYPTTASPKKGALAPQSVTAYQEWQGWYRIKSWQGDVWVKPGH